MRLGRSPSGGGKGQNCHFLRLVSHRLGKGQKLYVDASNGFLDGQLLICERLAAQGELIAGLAKCGLFLAKSCELRLAIVKPLQHRRLWAKRWAWGRRGFRESCVVRASNVSASEFIHAERREAKGLTRQVSNGRGL